MPLLVSCMMAMDNEMILDDSGHVCISVRGYVYSTSSSGHSSDAASSPVPAIAHPLAVTVYDKSDDTFSEPLAFSHGRTDFSGYYEIDMALDPVYDIIIRVSSSENPEDSSVSFVSGIYSWSDSLYDEDAGRYVANMPPLYIE